MTHLTDASLSNIKVGLDSGFSLFSRITMPNSTKPDSKFERTTSLVSSGKCASGLYARAMTRNP